MTANFRNTRLTTICLTLICVSKTSNRWGQTNRVNQMKKSYASSGFLDGKRPRHFGIREVLEKMQHQRFAFAFTQPRERILHERPLHLARFVRFAR